MFKVCRLLGMFLTQVPHTFSIQTIKHLNVQKWSNQPVFGLFSQTNSCDSVHPHNKWFVLIHTPKTVPYGSDRFKSNTFFPVFNSLFHVSFGSSQKALELENVNNHTCELIPKLRIGDDQPSVLGQANSQA